MAATNLVFDTAVTPFAPNANQAHVNFGWNDPLNIWSTDSSGNIQASAAAASPPSLLYRNGSGPGTSSVSAGSQENSLNQRVKMTFTINSVAISNGPAIILRSNNNNTALNGYLFTPSPSLGTLRAFHFINGAFVQITNGAVPWTIGHSYTLDVEVAQTNSSTSTFTVFITDNTTSTVLINGTTLTDTTSVLQNPTQSGMGLDATGNGVIQTVTRVQYYTDQAVVPAPPVTAYSVSVPGNGVIGLPNSGTIETTGSTLTGPMSINFTTSNGGQVVPNPVVLTSGQGSANFAYTPANSGSETLSWAYSGGNVGITGDSSQSETVVAPTLTTDGNLFWTDGWQVQSSGAYANNAGQYLKMAFTGSAFQILFDITNIRSSSVSTAEWPVIRYSLDGAAPVDLQLADHGVNTFVLNLTANLSGASTHTFYMILRNETQLYNRWNPNGSGFPPSGIRVQSFVFASGGGTTSLLGTALQLQQGRAYLFGDSITEGSKTSYPFVPYYSDSEATWGNAACDALGCEYSNYAFSGQAFSGQNGVPDVPHFGSAWNFRFLNQTKLSGGTFLTNSGSPLPTYILINMGTNDAENSASKTVGSITSVITAIKAASPGSIIVLVLPFAYHQPWFAGQGYDAFLLSEYTAYLAIDHTAILVDLGASAGVGLASYPASSVPNPYSLDQLHPGGQRSTNLGTLVGQTVSSRLTIPRPAQIFYP